MPVKPKKLIAHTSSELRVVESREKSEKAHEAWIDNKDEKIALGKLLETYSQVKVEELELQTRAIESGFGGMQYGEAGKVVNLVSGRKKIKEDHVVTCQAAVLKSESQLGLPTSRSY